MMRQPSSHIVACATEKNCATLQLFHMDKLSFNRLPKCEISLSGVTADSALNKQIKLEQYEIQLCLLYASHRTCTMSLTYFNTL